MKTNSLNFFSGFKCIANHCKHSCCTKWQIDIDKKSLKHYINIKNKKPKGINSSFTQKLESGIDYDNASFKLEKGRCAFLDSNNLCEIYTNLGENSLCQVCADHPRYRNFFSNKIELGISLACEVIASKVINFSEKAEEIIIKKGISFRKFSKFEKEIIEFRQSIVEILQNREIDFRTKFDSISSLIKVDQNKLYNLDIKNTLFSLEILDEKWKEKVSQICDVKSSINFIQKHSVNFEQLGVYFVYKHLPNSIDHLEMCSRTAFCMLSLLIIANITEKQPKNDINTVIDIAREYSEEIEYNDENVFSLLDILEDILIK